MRRILKILDMGVRVTNHFTDNTLVIQLYFGFIEILYFFFRFQTFLNRMHSCTYVQIVHILSSNGPENARVVDPGILW